MVYFIAVLALLYGLSLLIAVSIPKRHFFHAAGWVSLIGLVLYFCVGASADYGEDLLLVIAVMLFRSALVVVALAFITGACFLGFRNGWRSLEPYVDGNGAGIDFLIRVQTLCWGAVAASAIFSIAAGLLQGWRPSWGAYVIVLVLVIVLIPLIRLSCRAAVRARWRSASHLSWLGGGLCVSLVLLIAGSVASAYGVARQAREVAAGRPYCIQTSNRKADYQVADALLDLSALVMQPQARKGVPQQEASLLIVDGTGRSFYSWSYRRIAYLPLPVDKTAPPAVYCSPAMGAQSNLPFWSDSEHSSTLVDLRGRAFRIPTARFISARGGEYASLAVVAKAPSFAFDKLNLTDYRNQVLVSFEGHEQLEALFAVPSGEWGVIQTTDMGLEKRPSRDGKYTQYFVRDTQGQLTTLIVCGAGECQHRYRTGGLVISFYHSTGLVGSWQILQQTMSDLLASWEAISDANG